ncbi:SIR2-like domain-containing protein [Halanaerobium congolense]|uniref:SIR2-like domain-containing protein n=1 Tax=Halanaerobium congolense TaxID=54121 RepID=A0A1G8NFN6_9FIRM|nr:SIR2 family protein [Halanaerobium congolense]SDI78907.1 SIR2-like domain-containing protein [Halanaerobium congolense]SET48433.1 SIR2-like domain-containing protein [Halanaerobium congolense]
MDSFIKESKKIIRKAMNNNKLVIFVGAGVSANSGLPSWKDLVNEFRKGIGLKENELSDDDYLKIPQYYYNLRKEKEYYELINEVFNVNAVPNILHDLIFQFNPTTIITTNYDELIEERAEEKGLFYDVVSRDKDLPYTQNDKMIIKMHGDLKYNNIVLKEEDYLSYSSNFKLIENYIKSLLSSNVVLFIGYRINDINMKIIFQWVKDILKNDFQPAYFINTSAKKDNNNIQFDYYKNRGINILNYNEAEKIDSFSDNPCSLSSLEGKKLYDFLLYLLNEEKVKDLDFYYQRLVDLDYLNMIRIKDLKETLGISREVSQNGNNLEFSNSETLDYLIKKLIELDNDDIENQQEISKLELIRRVFEKSGIEKIKKNQETIYKVKKKQNKNRLIKSILEFDYISIHNNTNKMINSVEEDESKLVERAYNFYQAKNYYEAYRTLKKASKIAFKNKNYITYSLSEFNRYYLGKILSSIITDINEEERIKIKEEVGKIDLDELYFELPADKKRSISFIKKIMSFEFVYIGNNRIMKLGEEVRKDKNTYYLTENKNSVNIFKLKREAHNFWDFINKNYLMIDNYKEIKTYFYRYIQSLLFNYSFVKEKIRKDSILIPGVKVKTIKIKNIDYFSSFIMIKYLKKKELIYLFEEYDIKELKVKEQELEKIIKSFKNLINSFLKLDNRVLKNEINNFLYLFSYIDIGKSYFNDILDSIMSLIKNKVLKSHEYRNISSFIIEQNSSFNNICVESLDELLFKLMLLEIENEKNKDLYFNNKIINNIASVINKNDSKLISKSSKLVSSLLENLITETSESKKNNNKYLLNVIVPLFKISNEKVKEKIRETIVTFLDKDFDINLYYNSVRGKIVDSNENYEKKAAEIIQNEIDKAKKREGKVYPDKVKDYLIKIGNLYLNEEIVSPDLFFKFKGENEIFDLFIDIDNFDYDQFKIDWIYRFSLSLHEEISKNKKAKKSIKRKLKKKIIEEQVNKDLKEIFFEYYD